MKLMNRKARTLLVAALAIGALGLASASGQSRVAGGVKQWSDMVWESAKLGREEQLQEYLDSIPPQAQAEYRDLLQQSVNRSRANAAQALEHRNEARAEAMEELREHIEANDLSKALRSAVEVQTLSEDMSEALKEREIEKVVVWANESIPRVKADGDWLLAQELLFRLRTLYDETNRPELFARYDDRLDQVNQRVSLLAEYAPRRLYDLRREQAERLNPEIEFAAFNPAAADDWIERVEGIEPSMVRLAMRRAAREHIEGRGWRPLLEGGLGSMKVIATTPSLGETFPGLQDSGKVSPWLGYIDRQIEELSEMSDERISRYTADRLLDRLVEMNEQTIGLPRAVLYREFTNGAMGSLDDYSGMIWPQEVRRFEQSTNGHFVGVGILISHDEKRDIRVVTPLEGSPAYSAHIKPEDRIVEVNGESTVGWSLNDAVDRITGPKGSTVTLGIRREGAENVLKIPVERDVVKIHSVKGWSKIGIDDRGTPTWDWMIDPIGRIAYLRLTSFSEDTYGDLLAAWDQISDRGRRAPNGLIIDLRYNPGGLLRSAVEISNLFVPRGSIVSGEDKESREEWRQEARANLAHIARLNVPTVVLINEGSASASEIVAGCLQAHDSALVIGHRSFGKGSVQTVHPLTTNSRVKLTTQYYRLPASGEERRRGDKGRLVHKRAGDTDWGVNPDILVDMTPEQIVGALDLRRQADMIAFDDEELEPVDINDLLNKGLDPQLESALLILQAKALGTIAADPRRASLN